MTAVQNRNITARRPLHALAGALTPVRRVAQTPRDLLLPAACLTVALTIWAVSLPSINPASLTDFGLVSILPWTVWIALALLTTGFVLSLGVRNTNTTLPFLHLCGLALVLHATPAIAYGTLRYSWAWKHIGIVDFIQRHGHLDPLAPFLSVYHNWPGFFLVSAYVADLFGLRYLEVSEAARFSPLILNFLYLCVLATIYRRFTSSYRLVWASAWVFLAGNWVGQDYFSPQGAAFLLYLIVIAICLGPLNTSNGHYRARNRFDELVQAMRSVVIRGGPDRSFCAGPVCQAVCASAVLVLIVAITATHQLTPVILIFASAGLAVLGALSVYFVIFAIVAELIWVLYFADAFIGSQMSALLAELGGTIPGMLEKLADTSSVSPGQFWVSMSCRALTAVIVTTACAGAFRRLAAGYRDGAAVVLMLAPLPVVAITSYGGELIFRTFLFALPSLAFFSAALFFPTSRDGTLRAAVTFGCFALLLAIGFLLANNGKDRQYWFSSDEVAAARWVYESAPPGTLLIEGARSYPSQFVNYENFTYLPLSEEDSAVLEEVLRDPASVLGRWLDGGPSAGFVIITRSQKAYIDDLGIMPPGSLDRLEAALLASPRFKLSFANANARVYALNPLFRGTSEWVE